MTIFEYFMVLLSVVLGLALAQLLTGLGELARAHERVRWSSLFAIRAALALLTIIDMWTSLWLVRDVPQWRLVSLLFLLGQAAAIYLHVLLLLPTVPVEGTIDLERYAIERRRLYLGPAIAYLFASVVTNVLFLPAAQRWSIVNFTVVAPLVVLNLIAWATPRRGVQLGAALGVLMMVVAYFAFYFPVIG